MEADAGTNKAVLLNFIREHFTNNLADLENVNKLREEYRNTITTIEEKLSLASSEVPSEIDKAIHNAEVASNRIASTESKVDSLRHEILDHVHSTKPIVGELSDLVDKVEEVRKFAEYLSTVSKIDDISSQIQASLLTESLNPAVDGFNDLHELYMKIQNSACKNLVHFLKSTILFWNNILKERLGIEFEEVLKALRWPMVTTNIKAPSVTNVHELKERMGRLFKKLLHLQLPESIGSEHIGVHPLLQRISGIKPLLLPLELMLKPLKKRFRYHFYGQKQTNSLDKPEWYFTQVLSWIRDHGDFLDRNIQPLLDDADLKHVYAKTELTRGLVMIVMEKIRHDLPELMYDEASFSHLVDEILLFDMEIRTTYSYPPVLPGCLDVLCLQDALTKWLNVEKKYAMEKVEQMFQSPTCWESQYKDIVDVDDGKVPECAENFMNLLNTITERYRKLPVAEAKLRFLGLQLELLEDFRMRLVQVMKEASTGPTSKTFCAVLNSVHYVQQVLKDWSELTFFLQLLIYKSNSSFKSTNEINESRKENASVESILAELSDLSMEHTVFEEITILFDGMESDMIRTASNYVFLDVQARSQPYRKDRWLALPSPKELSTTLGLSATACEMFLVLKDHLATMQVQLNETLFDVFWHNLAKRIDNFVLYEVVFANHFNDGGALQLQFDICRNLIPLFGDFSDHPESYFRLSKEACILLTLQTGSAILLKEVLYSHLHENEEEKQAKQGRPDVGSALRDVGVFVLSPEQCEHVFSLRTNLSIS